MTFFTDEILRRRMSHFSSFFVQKYGVNIRKMESEEINIESLYTPASPPELENE